MVRLALALALATTAACASVGPAHAPQVSAGAWRLRVAAESPRRWTGVAVAANGRVFVSYPRWSEDVPVSVAELVDGTPRPYPDARWNDWRPGDDVATHFVAVQSVVATRDGTLWVLDPGNPRFSGVLRGAPKLVAIELATNQVRETYLFDATVADGASYLNDVRVDLERQVAYLTDSGRGAIVVLDLQTHRARRLLDPHPATTSEDVDVVVGGRAWQRGGTRPQVHADGLALSPDGAFMYFQALTGRTLYRVPTEVLRDDRAAPRTVSAAVEALETAGAADGLEADARGLFHTSLELDAVRLRTPDGSWVVLARDPRLAWPDSLAIGPDGHLWVTTAQIHLGDDTTEPFRLFELSPP